MFLENINVILEKLLMVLKIGSKFYRVVIVDILVFIGIIIVIMESI